MDFLRAVTGPQAPPLLRLLPAVQTLRAMWIQEYVVMDGVVRRRDIKDRPPGAKRLVSPYDTDARGSVKRGTFWDGYKVHLTETCEPDAPNLITHVATADSTVQDVALVRPIHAHLAERDWLPAVHLLDSGYTTAGEVVTAHEQHGIELIGPVLGSTSWQTRAGEGYTQDDFMIDWTNQQVTCPNGKTSNSWAPGRSQQDAPVIRARFSIHDCRPCTAKAHCTRAETSHGRRITLRPRPSMRSSDKRRPGKQAPSGRSSTPTAPAWKGPSPRASAPSTCADVAISASPKPGSSISSLPPR